MKFNDLINNIRKEVEGEYEALGYNSIIIDIDALISELNGTGISGKSFQYYTPDELSRMAGRLATLRASLIEVKYQAFLNVKVFNSKIVVIRNSTRTTAREEVEKEHKSNGWKSPNKDEIAERLDNKLVGVQLTLNVHEAMYEKLQSYWYAIPDVLHRIQQRIEVLVGDKNTSKFMTHSDADVPIEYDTGMDIDRTDSLKD